MAFHLTWNKIPHPHLSNKPERSVTLPDSPCPPNVPHLNSPPVTPVLWNQLLDLLFFEDTRNSLASGPLHLLFPQIEIKTFPSLHSGTWISLIITLRPYLPYLKLQFLCCILFSYSVYFHTYRIRFNFMFGVCLFLRESKLYIYIDRYR